jgi:hypothetical protein
MKRYLIGGAVALAFATTSLSAAPIHSQIPDAGLGAHEGVQIWLARGNEGKGGGNARKPVKAGKGNGKSEAKAGKVAADKGNGRPEHAGGPKPRTNGNDKGAGRARNGKGPDQGRRAFGAAERDEIVARLVATPAPAGRDMAAILGAAALAFATPRLLVADTPDPDLITYVNCPPGLARKDPPCVPPGQAKKGVTYDEWASYDRDRYDAIWLERRGEWLEREPGFDPDPDFLLLQSDQIATLYGLAPAPEGQRYGLIDGLPVLLDDDDYLSLLRINQIARVPDPAAGVPIAPTAALTQPDLIRLYRLPDPGPDQNYAVLNGQIVQLSDSAYDVLQMIRVARAVL